MCGRCSDGQRALFINKLKQAAIKAVPKVLEVGKPDKRYTGAFVCVVEIGKDGFLLEPMLVGEIDTEKGKKSFLLCQEKAHRLEAHLDSDVVSWQSRNPQNSEWGGAILAQDDHGRKYAIGISGLPEIMDEVAAFIIAVEAELLHPQEAIENGEISGSADLLVECLDWDGKMPETEGSR